METIALNKNSKEGLLELSKLGSRLESHTLTMSEFEDMLSLLNSLGIKNENEIKDLFRRAAGKEFQSHLEMYFFLMSPQRRGTDKILSEGAIGTILGIILKEQIKFIQSHVKTTV